MLRSDKRYVAALIALLIVDLAVMIFVSSNGF
jgi:hypothetical protein